MNGKRDVVGLGSVLPEIERGGGDGRWERGKTDEEEGRSKRASYQYRYRADRRDGIACQPSPPLLFVQSIPYK